MVSMQLTSQAKLSRAAMRATLLSSFLSACVVQAVEHPKRWELPAGCSCASFRALRLINTQDLAGCIQMHRLELRLFGGD